MTINIYKKENLILSLPGENVLVSFFKNRENTTYTIESNIKKEATHILKYFFEGNSYSVIINDIIAESILNEYRTEWVNE